MISRTIEFQAREYVYDLKNRASEFGFNNLEGWQFSLVTDLEKTRIEKEYYPTISAHPEQEGLFEFLRLVKGKLLLPLSKQEYGFDADPGDHKNLRHLIAFNPKMHR
ncbi:hypothetical protein [Mucilaginibacter sp. BT774]|uniref:hypothetical protein n=1 Tax=Mucilaginibacter sp. BT774 TaxID=3062276 RepID=UPI002674ABA9|nr:hypothetical protein [Mucilaginibacter sp. BT774]MDO3628478.1 hypothetical protein [Mucilaginibacter sp. BT774]